ncbi:MAG: hypothetical protein GY943_16575 [Chloroflexi bacterium]|nr:hypothetical protein [Chloroflexota bacterium]
MQKDNTRPVDDTNSSSPYLFLLQNVVHDVASTVESMWFKLENLSDTSSEDEGFWRQQQDSMLLDVTYLAQLTKDAKLILQPNFVQGNRIRELVNVHQLCENVMRVLSRRAKEEGVRLIYSAARQLPPVFIDPNQIQRAVLNLVDNAIKYADLSKEEAKVVLSTHVSTTELSIIVSDNGIGIQDNQLEDIWGVAFRTQNAQNVHVIGTGLGLAIVKLLTDANQGRVDVQSVLGQGSIFTIYLPLNQFETTHYDTL